VITMGVGGAQCACVCGVGGGGIGGAIGHWTLLVAERKGDFLVGPIPYVHTTAPQDSKHIGIEGCGSCRQSLAGCMRCNIEKQETYLTKQQEELRSLSLECKPPIQGSEWELRYYDTLAVPSARCKGAASTILSVLSPLGVPQELTT
jgi:hypothetical protein